MLRRGELPIEESFRMNICVHSLLNNVTPLGSKIWKRQNHSRGSQKTGTRLLVGSRRGGAATLTRSSRLGRFGLYTLTLVIGAKESDAHFVLSPQQELRAQGFTDVTLWVFEDNERALRFYMSNGFVRDSCADRIVDRGGKALSEVRMRKQCV